MSLSLGTAVATETRFGVAGRYGLPSMLYAPHLTALPGASVCYPRLSTKFCVRGTHHKNSYRP